MKCSYKEIENYINLDYKCRNKKSNGKCWTYHFVKLGGNDRGVEGGVVKCRVPTLMVTCSFGYMRNCSNIGVYFDLFGKVCFGGMLV